MKQQQGDRKRWPEDDNIGTEGELDPGSVQSKNDGLERIILETQRQIEGAFKLGRKIPVSQPE